MLSINIGTKQLDIYEDTSISIELNSTLYLGEDAEVMPGSFVFPFDVPLTANNKAILNDPHAKDNAADFMRDVVSEITLAKGISLFGFLTVLEASNYSAKIEIIFNPFRAVKDTPMNELEMGDYSLPSTLSDARELMTDTVYNPKNYPFVYISTFNELFNTKWSFQNHWGYLRTHYSAIFDTDSVVTPFLRIEYILEKIVKNAGLNLTYSFISQKDNAELALLCLYHNNDIMTKNGLPTTLSLQRLLNKTKTGEFVKNYLRRFNAGLFWNPTSKDVSIRTANEVITNAKVNDYTDKVEYYYTITNITQDIKELSDNDNSFDFFKKTENLYYIISTASEIGSKGKGIYKLADREFYYMPTNEILTPYYISDINTNNVALVNKRTDNTYVSPITIPNQWRLARTDSLKTQWYAPVVNLSSTAEASEIVIPFRGVYESDGSQFIVANPDTIHYNGNVVKIGNDIVGATNIPEAKYSHRWTGSKGLFAQFWAITNRNLQFKKKVVMKILLDIDDIKTFSFAEKIKVGNQIYLPKSLKTQIGTNGIISSEIELINII